MRKISLLFLAVSAFALSACEATDRARNFDAKVAAELRTAMENERPREPESLDVSRSVDIPFLGSQIIRRENGAPLPANLEREDAVMYASSQPQRLREIASTLGARIGIPVRVGNIAGALTCPASGTGSAAASVQPQQQQQAAQQAAAEIDQTMQIVYSGPLSRLLRNIASRYNVEWTYADGAIVFYRYETSVWNIYASPASTQLETGIQNQSASNITSTSSSSGGSGIGSGQNGVTQSLRLQAERMSTLDEMERTIRSFLPAGSCSILSPSTRTIAVTTLPAVRRQVERYIREQNERMTRQASIEIVVYNVVDSGNDNYGLNLAQAFRNTRSGFQFNTTGAPSGITQTVGN
ncbi:MAG: hypothetical protein ING19_03830, partial [Azospirillum sp.]|nr:hypothetical protein [Azospirillum sp.]